MADLTTAVGELLKKKKYRRKPSHICRGIIFLV